MTVKQNESNAAAGSSLSLEFHYSADTFPVHVEMIEGEPWFVANHLCEILGIKNSRDAVSRLDDDERRVSEIPTPSRGIQQMSLVNESGLYALIIRSNKPQARKFRKWVTSEVLPSIRKTGSYGQAPTTTKADVLQMMLAECPTQEHEGHTWYKATNLLGIVGRTRDGGINRRLKQMQADGLATKLPEGKVLKWYVRGDGVAQLLGVKSSNMRSVNIVNLINNGGAQ